jgi:hypothetical protein
MQFHIQRRRYALLSSMMATVLVVAACGGGNSDENAAVAEQETANESAMEVTPTSTDGTWTKKASEGQSFSLSTTKYVRYGAGSSWVGKWVSGTVSCSNWFFGKDPIYGVVKQCDVYTAATTDPAPTPTGNTATLTWTAPTSGAAVGYRVYYGTASKNYSQTKGSGTYSATTNISLSDLPTGNTYYFAVTAVDAAGVESSYSNEVAKSIP